MREPNPDNSETSANRRKTGQIAAKTVGAVGLPAFDFLKGISPVVEQKPFKERSFPERLRSLREEPILNPRLFKELPPESGILYVKNHVIDSRDSFRTNIALLNTLINCPEYVTPELIPENRATIETICRAGETFLLIHRDPGGLSSTNKELLRVMARELNSFAQKWLVPSNSRHTLPDSELAIFNRQLDRINFFFSMPPEQAEALRKQAISGVQNLIATGKIAESWATKFVFALNNFTGVKGQVASLLVADQIIGLAARVPGQNLGPVGLLSKSSSSDELNDYTTIVAAASDPSTWLSQDWDKLRSKPAGQELLPGFRAGFDILAARRATWGEYIGPQEKLPKLPAREYRDVQIYGEEKPLTMRQTKQIFQETAGTLFDKGMPSFDQIMKNRKDRLSVSKRSTEFVLTKSVWEDLKNQLRAYEITPEEYLMMHIDELNEMMQNTTPKTDARVKLERILIIDDASYQQKAEQLRKYRHSTDLEKEHYFFINPPQDPGPFVDTVSPWSMDVQGRWVYDTIFNINDFLYRRRAGNGKLVPLDIGMGHEAIHQLFEMADYYHFNSADKEELWQGQGNVPVNYLKYMTICEKGVFMPMGHNAKPYYPWPEAIHWSWLQKKAPNFVKTRDMATLEQPEPRPEYEILSGIPIRLTVQSDEAINGGGARGLISGSTPAIFEPVSTETKAQIFEISPREMVTNLFSHQNGALNILLDFHSGPKHYFLPVPSYLINAGYKAADMEGSPRVHLDIKFYQPPFFSDPPKFDMLELRLIDESEYSQIKEKLGSKLYAEMKVNLKGQNYYAFWSGDKQ